MKKIYTLLLVLTYLNVAAQTKVYDSLYIANLKQQVLPLVAAKEKQVQEMVDMVLVLANWDFRNLKLQNT